MGGIELQPCGEGECLLWREALVENVVLHHIRAEGSKQILRQRNAVVNQYLAAKSGPSFGADPIANDVQEGCFACAGTSHDE